MTSPSPNPDRLNASTSPSTPGVASSPGSDGNLADADLDPVLAARLGALAESSVSPLRPPDAFLAAVARRRQARRMTRGVAGLAIAAAVVLAGLAIRAAMPTTTSPGPNGRGVPVVVLAADPSAKTRIDALRSPSDPLDLPATTHATSSAPRPANLVRAGYSAAMLRGEGRVSFR